MGRWEKGYQDLEITRNQSHHAKRETNCIRAGGTHMIHPNAAHISIITAPRGSLMNCSFDKRPPFAADL